MNGWHLYLIEPTAVPAVSRATQTQVNKTNPENTTYDAKQALANFTSPQKSVQNQQKQDVPIIKPEDEIGS